MSGPIARRVVVRGRVQGVFFRDSTREEALRRGIAGWVTNRRDGAVEAHLEGSEDAVDAVVEWCRSGPRHADVDDVDVREAAPEGHEDFRIR